MALSLMTFPAKHFGTIPDAHMLKCNTSIITSPATSFTLFKDTVSTEKEKQFIEENIRFATRQTENRLKSINQSKAGMPHSIRKDGTLLNVSIYEWTSGFFPGILWYLTEYNNDNALKDSAILWTKKLEPVKTFTANHDIGFMMYCSYGNAYRFTKNEVYKDVLIQSARSLCTRYNKTTGCIKSWNSFNSWHGNQRFNFPVIIDNMMNLELLFFASEATGDSSFRKIAISHAEKAMQNQIRKDYSSYHLVLYDTATGKAIKGETAQGYADNSTWARGQAWGIYGFTMVYRETKDPRFLKTAQGMADYYIDNANLPADKIALWDFNANEAGYTPGIKSHANNVTEKYRDASAAATTASALLELSTYSQDAKAKKYFDVAKQILHSLAGSSYRAKEGANANFILMHSVGSIPHNSEIDVPLIYADYYYLEALMRYDLLLNKKPLFSGSEIACQQK
jgi:chondroitin AC lyase